MKTLLICLFGFAFVHTTVVENVVGQDAGDVSDEVLIELYDGARVADVVDGLPADPNR